MEGGYYEGIRSVNENLRSLRMHKLAVHKLDRRGGKRRTRVTYSVPSTERLLNAKHFSRLPPKSVARQEALWQDTLGSVRALCQGREYNSSGLTCHLKEAVRARNSIDLQSP